VQVTACDVEAVEQSGRLVEQAHSVPGRSEDRSEVTCRVQRECSGLPEGTPAPMALVRLCWCNSTIGTKSQRVVHLLQLQDGSALSGYGVRVTDSTGLNHAPRTFSTVR